MNIDINEIPIKKDWVILYTDGSYKSYSNKGRWSFIIHYPDGTKTENCGNSIEEISTNNRMELTAVLFPLPHILNQGFNHIKIVTDSKYVIYGIERKIGWRKSWNKRLKKGIKIPNKDLWEELWNLMNKYKPEIVCEWVKGHNGHEQNERCDEMACRK